MDIEIFRSRMYFGAKIERCSEELQMFNKLSQEAIRATLELNTKYHTPEEIVEILSKITKRRVDKTLRMFPPFYTDCGVNITFGKNVFINADCKFQDQGGIEIGDNVLIGHNVVIATLNHDFNPSNRIEMTAKKVVVGNNVWIGSSSVILPGGTIGDGSIIAAGSVVTKNVDENVLVAGNPARIIRKLQY